VGARSTAEITRFEQKRATERLQESVSRINSPQHLVYYEDIAANCAASIFSPKAVKNRFTFSMALG
jgi:hypothetical protein